MREAGGPVRRGGTSRLINTDYTSAMHSIVASLISGHLTDDTAAPHVSAEMLFESHGAVSDSLLIQLNYAFGSGGGLNKVL